ncbi:MAG: hypothetical protein ABSC57_08740 [Syntrophales bacterium]
MTRSQIVMAVILSCFVSGCSGVRQTVQDTQTGAIIASAEKVPGAGVVGIAADTVDLGIRLANYFKDIDKPKVKRISPKLNEICQKIYIADEFDENHQFVRRSDYATLRENGQKKKILVKDVPRKWLNQKSAVDRAMTAIIRGYLADDDINLLNHNLEIWKNGGLLVIEYHGYYYSNRLEAETAKSLRKGPEGATVIAVSDKNEPFEIMLPDEWEQRKAEFLKADSKPNTLKETAKKEGNQQ